MDVKIDTHSRGTMLFALYQAHMIRIFYLFKIINLSFLYLSNIFFLMFISRIREWERTSMRWCVFSVASEY